MAKIVIDARESGTGTGRYIDKLVENLSCLRPDFEVTVLTKASRVDFLRRIAPDFQVLETPYGEFGLGEQVGFLRQLNGLRADVVHFGMVQQPVLYRGKVVTTMMDLTTTRFKNPAKNPAVFYAKQQVYKWVNKRAAKKSAHIITISEFSKHDIVQFAGVSPDKISVTYPAADPISEPAKPLKDLVGEPFIMYLGRPLPHKNLRRLIDAFALLKATKPQLKLVLAGKKDVHYQQIEQEIIVKNIEGIVFTDFVSEGELKWLYENCRAYVFPSLSEGFGLPGLEAMVHGAPVVSSNATCLPEVYGNAAHYFDPTDIQAMADATNEVLTDKDLRNNLIEKGHIQAKKYSWHHMAKQTLRIYESALYKR